MATIHDELIGKARAAGAQAGSATQMLRDAIREAYAAGSFKFDDAVICDMRSAFREACAAAGKSKNAGNVLFARAWDDLIEEGLALEARTRKGMGKNGKGKASKAESEPEGDGEGDESGKAPVVDKAAIAREMLAAAGIDADLIKLCIAAFEGLKAVAKDATHKDAAKDAQHALKTTGNRLDKLMQAAGAAISRDEAVATAEAAAPKAPKGKGGKSKATKVENEVRA